MSKGLIITAGVLVLGAGIFFGLRWKAKNTPSLEGYEDVAKKLKYFYKGQSTEIVLQSDTKIILGDYTIEPTISAGKITGATVKNKAGKIIDKMPPFAI